MAVEIEHKYLVVSTEYREMAKRSLRIRQGYLSRRTGGTVRVRVTDDCGFLTVKGRTDGDTRLEFEYAVPLEDALSMLRLCEGNIIDKTRYFVEYEGWLWEVDEFHSVEGHLVIAEIELQTSGKDYPLPPFVGREVTGDPAYYNSNM